jgi:membrane-associated phospholipid phosphatase
VIHRSARGTYLGFHRLCLLFAATQLALLCVTGGALLYTGIRLEWQEVASVRTTAVAFMWIAWLLHVRTPGRHPREWVMAETFLVIALLLTFSNIGSPLQYAIIAFRAPLADAWLAKADALLGVHVPALVSWTAAQPALTAALVAAYTSLLPQFVLPPLVLGCWYRDRKALWEYAWNFQFCLIAALVGLALFPAACAFTYYGFDSLLDQTRFTAQFNAVRNGAMSVLPFDNMEGMITFPSFHVAGGLLVTWAFRRYAAWAAALGLLNAALIVSTVLTGAHYVIDVVAAFAVFGCSVWLWRRVAAGWIEPATRDETRALRHEPAAAA